MLTNSSKILIEPQELIALLSDETHNLRIVNANYPSGAKADHIFRNERIPTARHIDVTQIGDKSQGLPCMLPERKGLETIIKELDLGKTDHIVCYGDDNIIGACRAFWMFKIFGFSNVSVLNGTFSVWKQEGGPIETGEESWIHNVDSRPADDFDLNFNRALLAEMTDVRRIILDDKFTTENIQLFDTRKKEVFRGDPKNLRSGHLPKFTNIPFSDLLTENGSFRSKEELGKILEVKKYNNKVQTIVSCNSGMTASVLYVAFNLLGAQHELSLYDGSWTEWVKDETNPVVQEAN